MRPGARDQRSHRSEAAISGDAEFAWHLDFPDGIERISAKNPELLKTRRQLKQGRDQADWLARSLADDDAIAWAQVFCQGGCGQAYPL